jgi:hypothetical protein
MRLSPREWLCDLQIESLKSCNCSNIYHEHLLNRMMQRYVYILLMILILFSGISVNIAYHYCGGTFSSSRVSLNGEPASCGMEHKSMTNSPIDLISRHCCEDVIHSFKINSIYIPSLCIHLNCLGQEIMNSFVPRNVTLSCHKAAGSLISGTQRPPGSYTPVCVEQQVICIFQI